MKVKWRFLVVGAGPSGSAAAITLAKEGHSVTLVEASRFDQPRVGELLSPEGQIFIQRLLPERHKEFFLTKIGIVGAWTEPGLRRFSDPTWWAVDRLGLDRALAQRAEDEGAQLHLGSKVQDLQKTPGGWSYRLGGEAREADWLLIATGRTGHLTRKVGAQVQKFDRQVALVAFLEGTYRSTPDMLIETTELGWWYGAPITSRSAVAVFMTDSDLDKGDPRQAWEARLAESIHARQRFGDMTLKQKPSRMAAGFSLLVPSYGDGWAAIGEAAASFDPLSNLGLGRAAETGVRLAEAFNRSGEDGHAPDLLAFSEKIGAEFKAHSGILIDDYRKVHHFPGSVFWARRASGAHDGNPLRVKFRSGPVKKLIFPEGQLFDCNRCGKCCRSSWSPSVDLSRYQVMNEAAETVELAEKHGLPPLRVLEDGRITTSLTRNGQCVFHQQQTSLCGLHETEYKPRSCQQFPFILRETPEGVAVGVSYLCDSVQRNEGRPLESYEEEVMALLAQRSLTVLPRNVPVSWGRGVDWSEYARLEEYLLSGDLIERIRACRWYLAEWLNQPGASAFWFEGPTPREWLIELEKQMAMYLVAKLEFAYFRTHRDLFDDLVENHPVHLWKSRWKGKAMDLLEQYQVHRLPWIGGEIERFLRALIGRKFLPLQTPLYHNLQVMSALPQVLRFYTAVHAAKREVEQAEAEDYYKALDVVELGLTAYARQDLAAQTFFYWHMGLYNQERGRTAAAVESE